MDVRDEVRRHYARAATGPAPGGDDHCGPSGCCGLDAACGSGSLGALYDAADTAEVPAEALAASLGCGNPIAVADLAPKETVLDLGSGGGIDVLLAASRVGPEGKIYGLDMTEEMLALARANLAKAGAGNVEFLKGYIEEIPLPAGSVDVVISNCVINLSADKPRVIAEIARVLKPGGRIGITDVVASDDLDAGERAERGSHVGCIAGALSFEEYRALLDDNGFTSISVEATHEAAPQMFSAIVKATKPGSL